MRMLLIFLMAAEKKLDEMKQVINFNHSKKIMLNTAEMSAAEITDAVLNSLKT